MFNEYGIRDIAKALVRIEKQLYGNHKGYTILNIGHDREITIAELVDTIIRMSGKDVGYQFCLEKPDGYARRSAEIRKLRDLIHFVPDTPLEVTLQDMITEFKEGRAWM